MSLPAEFFCGPRQQACRAAHTQQPQRPSRNARESRSPPSPRNSPVAILIQKIRFEKELWKAKDSCEVTFIRYNAVAMATMDWGKERQRLAEWYAAMEDA